MLYSISSDCLTRILLHYKENGLTSVEKKSGGHINNHKAVTYEDSVRVSSFLKNYAEVHALALPGIVPGFWHDDVCLLPLSHTLCSVYEQYKAASEEGTSTVD